MKPGIYEISREEYEAIEAINYSTLKHFNKSAAHVREEMLHPIVPTPAMELGNTIHIAVLEPEKFNDEYVVAPKIDRRTKKGKAEWMVFEAENEGKTLLSKDDWQMCQDIIKKIKDNETFRSLIYSQGKNELSFVWEDKHTGLLCKGRLDRITRFHGWTTIVDVKTTVSAQVGAFINQSARMNYHMQSAFYLDGLQTIQPLERSRAYFIYAIEKTRPYGMRIFELEDSTIHEGRQKYRDYLKQYKACLESGIWPGYSDAPEPLTLPGWAVGDYKIDLEEDYK